MRDIYATAIDYDVKSDQAQLFFKKVQNKMLWVVTGHTAAELIVERADPVLPNMGLTSWNGSRVRQQDVTIAKNYLDQPEIEELNRIVVMYLDHAEDQAKRRKTMTMADWEQKLDAFLSFNERDLLGHAGKVSAQVAETLALDRYEEFDEKRRKAAKIKADVEDIMVGLAKDVEFDSLHPQIKKDPANRVFYLEVERVELSSLANSASMTTRLSSSVSQLFLMEDAPLGNNSPFVISNHFFKKLKKRIHTRKDDSDS